MRLFGQKNLLFRKKMDLARYCAVGAAGVLLSANVIGQVMAPNIPGFQTMGPFLTADPLSGPASVEAEDEIAAESLSEPPSKFDITFFGGGGLIYDDNIFISETNRVGDMIFTLSGGVSLTYGDPSDNAFGVIQYGATGMFYVENPNQNGVNQSLMLQGGYAGPKTTVTVAANLQYLTGPDRQVGDFADRFLLPFTATVRYDYSEKLQLGLTATPNFIIYQDYLNSGDISATAFADYALTGKIKVGLGAQFGILEQEDSSTQTYESLLVRFTYDATAKLNFFSTFGPQFRQYGSGGKGADANFVFSLGGTWTPRENTSVTIQAYRSVVASPTISGESYYATGVSGTISQLVLSKLQLALSLGYEYDEFFATENDVASGQNESYFFVEPSIRFAVTRFANIGVFYSFRMNDSNVDGSSWTNNRVGIETTFQF